MGFKAEKRLSVQVVKKLKGEGQQFPVSVERLLPLLGKNPVHVIRELARGGFIENPELYEGNLPLGIARKLEKLGVLNRAMLRERLASGQLDLNSVNYIGRKRIDAALKWANLEPSSDRKVLIRVKLPVHMLRNLQSLAECPAHQTMNEAHRVLIDEVLAAFDISKAFSRNVSSYPRRNGPGR